MGLRVLGEVKPWRDPLDDLASDSFLCAPCPAQVWRSRWSLRHMAGHVRRLRPLDVAGV